MESKNFKKYIILSTYIVVLFLTLSNLSKVTEGFAYVIRIFSPLLIGIFIAFVLNILMGFFENKLLKSAFKKNKLLGKHKRIITIILTFITMIILAAGFILYIIPQVVQSTTTLIKMLPTYATNVQNTGLDLYQQLGLSDQIQNALVVNLKDIALSLSNFTANTVNTIFNFSVNLTYGVLNFLLGIIFSVYILFSKEKLIEILRKLNLVFVKKPFAETLIHVADESSKTFARFVRGQLLGSLILGLLCFIGMLIFKIPYAPLTSVLIAVTSLIPMFGAFIGIIPATFIIYMESPVKALIFIIFIIILQQFEGNVLYPKIVGDAIGLDGFWVFLAITVGGSVYGVVGMLFGIPIMAVTYTLVREATYKRLERRKNGCL